MGSKEMAPVTQVRHQETTGPSLGSEKPGRAQVGDAGSEELNSVRAMEEVMFQQLRQSGLQAQRSAMELFKSGQASQASDLLTGYLKQLDGVQLDAERLSVLRRPVENRLQQYKTVQAQSLLATEKSKMTSPVH